MKEIADDADAAFEISIVCLFSEPINVCDTTETVAVFAVGWVVGLNWLEKRCK